MKEIRHVWLSISVGHKDCRSDSKYRPNIVSRRIVLRVRRYYRIADISMRFQHSPIETVGGVRENVQNRQKTAMTFVTLTLTL